ncbi:MAG: hypothetical protein R2825_05660 [Saprospiraceae bacterium]
MKDRIRTLKDLQAKQDSLKLQAEVSKQLFLESFSATRRNTTDFVLKGILMPAGAAGLAAWGAKKIFGNDEEEIETNFQEEEQSNGLVSALLPKLLPIGLSLMNAYLTKQFVQEEVEQAA